LRDHHGNQSTTYSVSQLDAKDFNINFNIGSDFDELSEDWNIISQASTRLELIHISGGNEGRDYLTFEKKYYFRCKHPSRCTKVTGPCV
jgi:hypothetical protein